MKNKRIKEILTTIKSYLPTVAIIKVEYSGSGDSGGIDHITVEDEFGINIKIIDDLNISGISYEVIRSLHPGWENNDGASGVITFDIKENKIDIDHNEYYTESQNYKHILTPDGSELEDQF